MKIPLEVSFWYDQKHGFMGPKPHMIVKSEFGLYQNDNSYGIFILIHSQIIVYQMKIVWRLPMGIKDLDIQFGDFRWAIKDLDIQFGDFRWALKTDIEN